MAKPIKITKPTRKEAYKALEKKLRKIQYKLKQYSIIEKPGCNDFTLEVTLLYRR